MCLGLQSQDTVLPEDIFSIREYWHDPEDPEVGRVHTILDQNNNPLYEVTWNPDSGCDGNLEFFKWVDGNPVRAGDCFVSCSSTKRESQDAKLSAKRKSVDPAGHPASSNSTIIISFPGFTQTQTDLPGSKQPINIPIPEKMKHNESRQILKYKEPDTTTWQRFSFTLEIEGEELHWVASGPLGCILKLKDSRGKTICKPKTQGHQISIKPPYGTWNRQLIIMMTYLAVRRYIRMWKKRTRNYKMNDSAQIPWEISKKYYETHFETYKDVFYTCKEIS